MASTDAPVLTGFALQRACLDLEGLTAPEKQVLTVLAIRADAGDATCTPGIARIMRDTGLGERTVQRSIASLAEAGHLTRTEILGRGMIYTVHPRHTGTPATAAPVPHRRETPATQAPKQPRTTTSQKASLSSRGKREPVVIDLPGWVPADAWAAYAEMREGMAKGPKPRPWTPSVAGKAIDALGRLARQGHDPRAVLDQSVLNGWQGLFALKGDSTAGRPSGPIESRRRVRDGFLTAIIDAEHRDLSHDD